MPGDSWRLPAITGREVRVSCGCLVVDCMPRLLSGDGRIASDYASVIVPCGDEHREVARQVAETVGTEDLDDIVEAMEAAI